MGVFGGYSRDRIKSKMGAENETIIRTSREEVKVTVSYKIRFILGILFPHSKLLNVYKKKRI